MKGVLICGGTGSRLQPLTDVTHKSLLPVYDKPLILHPLGLLLQAGIQDIVIITGPEHAGSFMQFLGSGERWGADFSYRIQDKPAGIAQALGMAEGFVGNDPLCAILGDNVFEDNLGEHIKAFSGRGGHLFLKEVRDPERFGVAEVSHRSPLTADRSSRVISLEEKPAKPKTNLAVTGCYLFDARCFDVVRSLRPSRRGELEITDVAKWYLEQGELTATVLQDEWIDAGTFESLFRAGALVREMKKPHIREIKTVQGKLAQRG